MARWDQGRPWRRFTLSSARMVTRRRQICGRGVARLVRAVSEACLVPITRWEASVTGCRCSFMREEHLPTCSQGSSEPNWQLTSSPSTLATGVATKDAAGGVDPSYLSHCLLCLPRSLAAEMGMNEFDRSHQRGVIHERTG